MHISVGEDPCPCLYDPKHMARFKEQPKHGHCMCCSSPRYQDCGSKESRLTLQERRAILKYSDEF